MNETAECRGCQTSVRLPPGEVDRLLASYLATNPSPLADDPTYAHRLAICHQCPDLQYTTTCRHCGCLVAIRAKLANKSCPAPTPQWPQSPHPQQKSSA